jgi:hypothetical protein
VVELDYRERLEPEAIVTALKSLKAGATKVT